jgi:tocopherol cyclase
VYALSKVWHPSWFQDGRATRGYFEGWYFKVVDPAGAHPLAIIPGVASESGGERRAFVQVMTGTGTSRWYDFAGEAFTFSKDRFEIGVGPNRFSDREIVLDLDDGTFAARGRLTFRDPTPWPVRPLSPGIMGPFRFVPFMECYHGVVSLDHSVSGSLEVDGRTLGFDGGRGYSEKDWGRSFPSAWVWVQSNRFGRDGVSLTASIARIPWVGRSFVGSIAGLLVDGKLYRFATYTGAKLVSLTHSPGGVSFALQDGRLRLEVTASGAVPGQLRSPVLGRMIGCVEESLCGTAAVRLTERRTGHVVFEGEGRVSGIEMMDPEGDLAM